MKGCWQWNIIYARNDFRIQRDLGPQGQQANTTRFYDGIKTETYVIYDGTESETRKSRTIFTDYKSHAKLAIYPTHTTEYSD